MANSPIYGVYFDLKSWVPASDSGEGAILPTWTAVDTNNVKTSRELWTYMKNEGWNVDDNYLDAYLNVIKTTDPHKTSLVFSCGMGAMRTTYAMVAACIVRRKRVMEQGWADPFGLVGSSTFNAAGNALKGTNTPLSRSDTPPIMGVSKSGVSTPSNSQIQMSMEQASAQQDLSRCLDHGVQANKLVVKSSTAMSRAKHREDILVERMKILFDQYGRQRRTPPPPPPPPPTPVVAFLNRAGKSLEKYFFMIAFASYVEGSEDFSQSFSDWLKTRTEIWNQIKFLRKSISGLRLNVFAPVTDLSALSRSGSQGRALVPGKKNDVAISGGEILGDEYSNTRRQNRSGGIILRERRNPDSNIYALGQPTIEAIDEVVRRVKAEESSRRNALLGFTLREEPIVYVNGDRCLRREGIFTQNNEGLRWHISLSVRDLGRTIERRLSSQNFNAFGGRLLFARRKPKTAELFYYLSGKMYSRRTL
ncbi:hypothetical protein VNI00_013296 [Paramarasmius palmivorus]|uniref:Uncharacterized protein n=1 Tax=Paramarasmius palmivorus TaxID=297713 RepID=A0AAW0C118_9AGAR